MTLEQSLQRLVLDWLQAKQILAFRMQTGAMKLDKRFVRFGVQGMADILAFPQILISGTICTVKIPLPTWIELKSKRGQQSEFQKSFQRQVEAAGHVYILARSLEDIEAVLI